MTKQDDALIKDIREFVKKHRYSFSQLAILALEEKIEREKQKEKILLAGEAVIPIK